MRRRSFDDSDVGSQVYPSVDYFTHLEVANQVNIRVQPQPMDNVILWPGFMPTQEGVDDPLRGLHGRVGRRPGPQLPNRSEPTAVTSLAVWEQGPQ